MRLAVAYTYMMERLSVSGSTSESLKLEILPYLSEQQGTTTSSWRACHGQTIVIDVVVVSTLSNGSDYAPQLYRQVAAFEGRAIEKVSGTETHVAFDADGRKGGSFYEGLYEQVS